jgi:hypothetical protein
MTEWRRIDEFPDYIINEYGDVMNERRQKQLTPRMNHQDFAMLGLVRDGVQYTRALTSLVATAYLDPPPYRHYDSVINLNGDRADCRAINLMWRPRWYATRYRQMFNEEPLRLSVFVPDIDRAFYSLREFCTTYGVVEKHAYLNMLNGDPCFHYGWKLERLTK